MAVDVRHQASPSPRETAAKSERLFEQYSARILAFCVHMLRDRGDADDAVQTTFLHAHRALGRGVTPEFEYAWLHSIAKNVCRMQLRTAGRRGQAVTGLDLDAIPSGRAYDDEEEELLRDVGSALASLPDRQRRAIVMREWQGYSSDEIATHLGMSAPATYALLTRARRSLARALTTVPRGPVLGLDLGSLLLRLKALLAGGAAKAAATTAIVAAVTTGGVAVELSLVEPHSGSNTMASTVRVADRSAAGRTTVAADNEANRVAAASFRERQTHRGNTSGLLSPRTVSPETTDLPGAIEQPGSGPEPTTPTGDGAPATPAPASDPQPVPDPEHVLEVPVDALPLPGVDLGGFPESVPDLPPLPETDPSGAVPPLPEQPLPPLPHLPDLPPLP